MLDKDMCVTINSDDPAYFRAYLNETFLELQEEGGFGEAEIVKLVLNGFDAAWIDEPTRSAYKDKVRSVIAAEAAS